jgi:hypothetical protein
MPALQVAQALGVHEHSPLIPRGESPTGEPLLAVAFTVSGSVTIFRVAPAPEPLALGDDDEEDCR